MRVGFPGGPRLEWYDRNPQPVDEVYIFDGVAPHAATVRFTYTVPTGKKFFLENAFAQVNRYTAAGTAGVAKGLVQARGAEVIQAKIQTNNVGDKDSMNVGRSVIALADEVVRGLTADGSTDGTVDYAIGFHGIEFDA